MPPNEFHPIIFASQDFQTGIEKLRALARWPLPNDPPGLNPEFSRKLYYTDAINAIKIAREVLPLLGQGGVPRLNCRAAATPQSYQIHRGALQTEPER